MTQNSANVSKNSSSSTRQRLAFTLVALLFVILLAGRALVGQYQNDNFSLNSEVAPLLRVFYYNESSHFDPVDGCWYDSGDYIVFAQRNAQSLFYLSLAYSYAQTDPVRQDLYNTITRQLKCLDSMLAQGYKQFRDQESHTLPLPPRLNEILTPQDNYRFSHDEGKDVLLLRALIAKNLNDTLGFDDWLEKSQVLSQATVSANCCEEGPLTLSAEEFAHLQLMAGVQDVKKPSGNAGWAVSFENLGNLGRQEYSSISKVLKAVEDNWDESARQFDYIGGNYDIAGTIALEKLYAKLSGDRRFSGLSDELYEYLHGDNVYGVDFANYKKPYHPCGEWWADCRLKETLINGIDEEMKFDPSRNDIWRLTEVQLTGQAEYLLSYILYHEL